MGLLLKLSVWCGLVVERPPRTHTLPEGGTGCLSECFCSSEDEILSSSDEEPVEKAQEKRRSLPKRKLKFEEYPEFIAKRYRDFRTYRNSTLQKWHDKTKLATGKMGKARPALCVLTWSRDLGN